MVYGFVATPKPSIQGQDSFVDWYKRNLEEAEKFRNIERSGWTPMYRLPGGPDVVLQRSIVEGPTDDDSSEIRISYPPFWREPDNSGTDELTASLKFSYALKESGAGALTITLSFQPRKEGGIGRYYSTKDVLAALLLAPRTEYGLPKEGSQVYDWFRELAEMFPVVEDWPNSPLSDRSVLKDLSLPAARLSNFSPAFNLFLFGMGALVRETQRNVSSEPNGRQNLLRWTEFGEPPAEFGEAAITEPDQETAQNRDCTYAIYAGARRDPQIPYMYVVGKMPREHYLEAFAEEGLDYMETRLLRSKFTKDIASVLNRWLDSRNIPYASCDHLEREGFTKHGAFVSNYMNSMLFTAFAGTAAITLQPCAEGDNPVWELPFEPAVHSITRFIEYSRMRWHQGISINRALDDLISEARDAGADDMPKLLEVLMQLRLKVARYMQNPITYRWDATVGTDVARYIHERVIGELENSTMQKMDLVKEFMVDRLDVIKATRYAEMINERWSTDGTTSD